MLLEKFKKIAAILLFVIFTGACSKPNDNDQSTSTYKVLEINSGTPVAGVRVDAYKCTSKDWLGNCNTIGAFVATTTTNNNGEASFPKSLEVGTLKAKKEKYWDHENPNPGFSPEFYLTPIATLKVHVIKVNTHPAGYVLNLVSQSQGCNDCPWETKQVGQPLDTYVYLKGAGYHLNSVGSYMSPGGPASGSSTPYVLINRFDTAQFEVRY